MSSSCAYSTLLFRNSNHVILLFLRTIPSSDLRYANLHLAVLQDSVGCLLWPAGEEVERLHIYVCISISVSASISLYPYICICIYRNVCLYLYLSLYLCLCLYLYLCVCVYISVSYIGTILSSASTVLTFNKSLSIQNTISLSLPAFRKYKYI